MKGIWGRVLWEGVKKRERDEVGGDPVGSTDPEVSRISHHCTFLAYKHPLCAIPGVKRQTAAHFWC